MNHTIARFTRTIALVVGAATVVLVSLLALARPAAAHEIDQSYIYLEVLENSLEGRLEFRAADLNDTLALDLPEANGPEAETAVADALPTILDYAVPRFALGLEGEPLTVTFTGEFDLIGTGSGLFVLLPFEVEERLAEVPETVDVRYEALVLENENHNGFVIIENYWEGGVFANESDWLLIIDDDSTEQTFSIDEPDFWTGFTAVVELGVEHIRIGTDHILFIVALLLPAVLVFRGDRWNPSEGFRSSLWRVLKIATFFTLAHSITLSLAGFGIVSLPSKPVETIIAISIALAALHNLRPVFANREWSLAFVFGLFHGLGFAGLLEELGLDRTNEVWSLLAFNLGVEIGQVVIIMLLFPALYLLRRTRLYNVGFRAASVGLAIVAMLWAIERVWEVDLKIDRLVDPITETPRAYVAIAIATLLAVLWAWFEDERRWSLATDQPPALERVDEEERVEEPQLS